MEPSYFDIASCDPYEILKRMLLRLKEKGYLSPQACEEVRDSEYFRNLPPHYQVMPEGFDEWSGIHLAPLFSIEELKEMDEYQEKPAEVPMLDDNGSLEDYKEPI